MKKAQKSGLLAASLVLVTASVAGCGGGAPTDASEKEFCASLTSLFTDLGSLTDASEKEALASIKAWAQDLGRVGTPEGIPDDARAGFELMIEQVGDLDANDTTEDFQRLDEQLSETEQTASAAFERYSADTCGATELEVPELPEIPAPAG